MPIRSRSAERGKPRRSLTATADLAISSAEAVVRVRSMEQRPASPCGRNRRTRRHHRGRRPSASPRRSKPREWHCAAASSMTTRRRSCAASRRRRPPRRSRRAARWPPIRRPGAPASGWSRRSAGPPARPAATVRRTAPPPGCPAAGHLRAMGGHTSPATRPGRVSAPESVMARWPPGSSSFAASVIGPGACTFTTRFPPRSPAASMPLRARRCPRRAGWPRDGSPRCGPRRCDSRGARYRCRCRPAARRRGR